MSNEKPSDPKKKQDDGAKKPAPIPERETDKKPHPSKGAGRRGNVQLPPDEQRGKPDPKQK